MRRKLHTAVDVIEACGGTRAVADRFDESYQTVWNWRVRDFPSDTYAGFQALLAERGCEAPAGLWAMRMLLPR